MTAMSSHGQADKDEPTTMFARKEKKYIQQYAREIRGYKYSRVTAYFIDTTI